MSPCNWCFIRFSPQETSWYVLVLYCRDLVRCVTCSWCSFKSRSNHYLLTNETGFLGCLPWIFPLIRKENYGTLSETVAEFWSKMWPLIRTPFALLRNDGRSGTAVADSAEISLKSRFWKVTADLRLYTFRVAEHQLFPSLKGRIDGKDLLSLSKCADVF